jgi:alpha-L-rhamnosidase
MNHFRILYLIAFLTICLTTNSHGQNQLYAHPFLNDLSDIQWIGDAKLQPESDSLMYSDDPAPLFRKEFQTLKPLKSAILYITAAGYYSATINGEKIGKNFLDPAWTSFAKRVYYSEYDITSSIQTGQNCLGVSLGNGFYNPLPMRMWGNRNLRETLSVGRPQFIAKLVITYLDGQVEVVKTDNQWKYSYGPIIRNNVYIGETYDARKEIKDWNKAQFDDSQWAEAIVGMGPGGRLQKSFFPAIQQTNSQNPVAITSPQKGVWLVDMGVNFTGLYKIRLQGKEGEKITMRFGERIYENGELNPMTTVCGQIKRAGQGGPGAPSIAWQTDQYIFGKAKEVWYTPEFTFHLFRYIEITGLIKPPSKTDIQGLVLHSNVKENGQFSTSSTLLNSIQQATKLTFTDNLMSVQSDCPARERFGYGGDLNATSESFIYNYDMQAFYRKTIYDWVDAVNDSVFIDIAPFIMKYCGISWESAVITTQEQLLNYYNDTAIVRELYSFDLKWMDKVARIHPEGIVKKGLADHESMIPVPVELIGTTHYLKCARIMKHFATIMGDTPNEKKFENLEQKLASDLLALFWLKPILNPINRQTLYATLLYYQLIPEKEKQSAVDSLLIAVKNGINGHFTTGIFGTKYILEALSQAGYKDKVYDIVNSKTYPGWGYMIDRGATTLWETWKESDNTYSNCHPMFGTVTEWFYRWLGGIRADPEYTGFKKFRIAPYLPNDLLHVNCSYTSPFGKITADWIKKGSGNYQFKMKVPKGCEALVKLPFEKFKKISLINLSIKDQGVLNLTSADFTLREGDYQVAVIL